jgi:hypothetical protein
MLMAIFLEEEINNCLWAERPGINAWNISKQIERLRLVGRIAASAPGIDAMNAILMR